jgi:hypothetical protein
MRRDGRTNRWWVRGFALLGLAVCSILPFGALGAIDVSFDSSVAVPLLRSTSLHQGGSGAVRRFRSINERHDDDVVQPVSALPPVAVAGGLVALSVLVALVVAAYADATPTLVPGSSHPRGPPSWC